MCDIIEIDTVSGNAGLSWSNVDHTLAPTVRTHEGRLLDVRRLDAIWWRRSYHPQRVPASVTDAGEVAAIDIDCNDGLTGLLLNEFSGVWVSDPDATRQAENKLVQLKAAGAVGLRVPRTLVSQHPAEIRHFVATLDGGAIVKPLRGSEDADSVTRPVTDELLASEGVLVLRPAIYQEYIAGSRHLRVSCFGDDLYAAAIESDVLDWRTALDGGVRAVDLSPVLADRLRALLRALGLRMGMVDLKLADDGEPVWLDVNPQGEFRFVQLLARLDLTEPCAAFLHQEARRGVAAMLPGRAR